jgi:hypothetical protein
MSEIHIPSVRYHVNINSVGLSVATLQQAGLTDEN